MALYFSYLEETDKEKFIDVYQKFNINKSDYFKTTLLSELGIKENNIKLWGCKQRIKKQHQKF